jgi:MYXO-CTERM domain-containing protein
MIPSRPLAFALALGALLTLSAVGRADIYNMPPDTLPASPTAIPDGSTINLGGDQTVAYDVQGLFTLTFNSAPASTIDFQQNVLFINNRTMTIAANTVVEMSGTMEGQKNTSVTGGGAWVLSGLAVGGTAGDGDGQRFSRLSADSDSTMLINGSIDTVRTVYTTGTNGVIGGNGTLNVGGENGLLLYERLTQSSGSNYGILSPGGTPDVTGNGVGTLTTTIAGGGPLDFGAFGRFLVDLDTPGIVGSGTNDLVALTASTLILDGFLDINAGANFGAGTYTLIQYSGGLTNNTMELGNVPAGYTYQLNAGAGVVDLVVTAVPEPASVFVGLAGLAAVALWRRKHA